MTLYSSFAWRHDIIKIKQFLFSGTNITDINFKFRTHLLCIINIMLIDLIFCHGNKKLIWTHTIISFKCKKTPDFTSRKVNWSKNFGSRPNYRMPCLEIQVQGKIWFMNASHLNQSFYFKMDPNFFFVNLKSHSDKIGRPHTDGI